MYFYLFHIKQFCFPNYEEKLESESSSAFGKNTLFLPLHAHAKAVGLFRERNYKR